MTEAHPDAIWYVAYGSNLSRARLQRYLDAAPVVAEPLADVPVHLDHRLFFAHESRRWTGGSAFLDPQPGSGSTLARAWLLRRGQFAAVLAQENARRSLDVPEPVWSLEPGRTLAVDDRRYGLALACDSPDERPALTFTTPEVPLPPRTTPAAAYVDTIVEGLVDAHDLDEEDARAYVAARVRD